MRRRKKGSASHGARTHSHSVHGSLRAQHRRRRRHTLSWVTRVGLHRQDPWSGRRIVQRSEREARGGGCRRRAADEVLVRTRRPWVASCRSVPGRFRPPRTRRQSPPTVSQQGGSISTEGRSQHSADMEQMDSWGSGRARSSHRLAAPGCRWARCHPWPGQCATSPPGRRRDAPRCRLSAPVLAPSKLPI